MKTLAVLLVVALSAVAKTHQVLPLLGTYDLRYCDEHQDATLAYRTSLYDFTLLLYKKIGERSNFSFVFSPLSVWMSLAAIAEGADPAAQEHVFNGLYLPNDPCTRQKYYNIMNTRIVPGLDVQITNKRTLVLDEALTVNPNWLSTVHQNSLIDVITSPIKRYPLIAANHMRQIISAPLKKLNLNGNSVILDSIDYNALWTSAFSDAVIERAPFYDNLGQMIGSVDLMTVSKRVKMVYVPVMNMKVLELPAGVNGRYRLLIGVLMSNDNNLLASVEQMTSSLLMEMLDNLKESNIPIDIALPRYTITSEIDLISIIEEVGLSNVLADPASTSYIATPAALPSSYVERATLTFNTHGLRPTLQEHTYNVSTGLDPILGRDFTANKPFLFSIMDAETYSCVLSGAYFQPTYSY